MNKVDKNTASMREIMLLHCALQIEKEQISLPPNRSRVSRHFISDVMSKANRMCNIKIDDITNLIKKRKKLGLYGKRPTTNSLDDACLMVAAFTANEQLPVPITPSLRNKGGRRKGETKETKELESVVFTAAKNEASYIYNNERKLAASKNKNLPKERIHEIISSVSTKRNLTKTQVITPSMLRSRYSRESIITNGRPGPESPLIEIEPILVEMLIRLCRIGQPLSVGSCKSFINSVINGSTIQQELIEWKKKCSHTCGNNDIDGLIGDGYWTGFLSRNEHKIQTKKGEKYELNRALWTTYTNMHHMYKLTQQEMVEEAGVAIRSEPKWYDANGNECDEENATGCKAVIEITHPEYCIVADETGGNTCQKDDGHVGGEKLICESGRGSVPKQIINSKTHHFTVMGLTLFNGDPLLCVIIFSGKSPRDDIELGYDDTVPMIGHLDDEDFMEKNIGKGKRFPCGPTCTYKGKKISCLCRWSENGSVTSEILKDICQELDKLKIFDRSKGILPFFLLDGHGSRFELPFLEYINDTSHKWCVCIGVPYGTSIWQVGDSQEQNGAFKTELVRFKRNLMEKRQTQNVAVASIEPTDIIPMINYAWDRSFANIAGNKKAILERGWFPFNRNLLLDSNLRSTMNAQDKENEKNDEDVIISSKTHDYFAEQAKNLPNYDPKFIPQNQSAQRMNFTSGISAQVLDKLVNHEELNAARARIMKNREEGNKEKKLLDTMKMSAGNLWKYGDTNRLGDNVLERQMKRESIKKETKMTAFNNAKNSYIKMQFMAAKTHNLDRSKWKMNDYKSAIAPLRRKGDDPWTKIPNSTLPVLYDNLIKTRHPLSFANHLSINHPKIKIPTSIDLSVLDLSPSIHPEWTGDSIAPKKQHKEEKKSNLEKEGMSTAMELSIQL